MRTQRRAAKKVDREAVGVIDEYEAGMRTSRDSVANLKVLTGDLGDAGRPAEPEEGPRSGATLVVTGGLPLTKRDQLSTTSQAVLLSSPTKGEVGCHNRRPRLWRRWSPQVYLSPCGRGYEGRVNVSEPLAEVGEG